MNIERQKTDAISDAVEIPDGATHYCKSHDEYFCLEDGLWFKYLNGAWWRVRTPPFGLTDIL